jgi:hypothetical protein
MGLIGKKGKPTARSLDQAPYGWVALRRFCPTLRVEAPPAVLGSWGSTGLQGSISGTDGAESLPALARRARKGAPDGFSGGSPDGLGVAAVGLTT